MRKHQRLILVTVLLAMSVLIVSVIPLASLASDAWSVEIASGKNVISLTQADIEKMPTVTAKAGFRKSGGKVEGPFDYKGVYMKDLLDKVGGIKKGQSLRVTSRDGYVETSVTLRFWATSLHTTKTEISCALETRKCSSPMSLTETQLSLFRALSM